MALLLDLGVARHQVEGEGHVGRRGVVAWGGLYIREAFETWTKEHDNLSIYLILPSNMNVSTSSLMSSSVNTFP